MEGSTNPPLSVSPIVQITLPYISYKSISSSSFAKLFSINLSGDFAILKESIKSRTLFRKPVYTCDGVTIYMQ